MKKVSFVFTVLVCFALFLSGGIKDAQADTLLFPYLSTQAGVFSFVTIANDGLAEYATINGYHLIYGHKTAPVVNTAACGHFNGNVVTTPGDMMTFEVNGKVQDVQSHLFPTVMGPVLFESTGIVSSTALTLPVANQIAFLIVEPLGVVEADDNVVRSWGWAEVIDTASNLSLAYSTHNFVNDVTGNSFGNIGAVWHSFSWYPTAFVTTSWHILPLGTAAQMSPAAGGGIKRAYLAWDGIIANAGAYDRDEELWSGGRRAPIRCFGFLTRDNLLQPGPVSKTDNGGWMYVGPSNTDIILLATDPVDPLGVYFGFGSGIPSDDYLAHKVQIATPAAGVGARMTINREPSWDGFPFAP